MKKYILLLTVCLAGCSALKTNNAPNALVNGSATTADLGRQIVHKQNDLVQLNRLLAGFPGRAMSVETGQPVIISQTGNQVNLGITVKANFDQEWLINLWRELYALGDPHGATTQITVNTVYDINGPDHWDTARYVRGTVKFIDRSKFEAVSANLINSRPTVQLTFINARNQAIYTRRVDMPALTHSYVDQTTPVFVDVGYRAVMRPINFDWPVAPIQMRINGDQPIWMTANLTVDANILAQTTRINAQIVRQN